MTTGTSQTWRCTPESEGGMRGKSGKGDDVKEEGLRCREKDAKMRSVTS